MFDRLPDVTYGLAALESLIQRLSLKQQINFNDQMAFVVNAGQFKAEADATSRVSKHPIGMAGAPIELAVTEAGNSFRRSSSIFQSAAVRTIKSIEKFRKGSEIEVTKLLGSGPINPLEVEMSA